MERFDAHVGALDGALQQRPEIFAAIGVDVPIDVSLGVVDDVMGVVAVDTLIREVRVSVDGRAGFDALTDDWLQMPLLAARKDAQAHLADAVLTVTVEQTHNGN